MNWPVFAIFAYLFVSLQSGLNGLMSISLGPFDGIRPDLLFILVVFIAMSSRQPMSLFWAALILGLLRDLQPVDILNPGGEPITAAIPGPHALGAMAGAFVVLRLRGMVFHSSALAAGVLTFVAGVVAGLVAVSLLALRGLGFLPAQPLVDWSLADALVESFLSLLYTSVLAVILHFPLHWSRSLWDFNRMSRARRANERLAR